MADLTDLILKDILKCVLDRRKLKLCQLNSIISFLIKKGIQFDLSFTPATATSIASAALVIYINPDFSLSITVNFDSGSILL